MSFIVLGYEYGKRQPTRQIEKTPPRIVDERGQLVFPVGECFEPEDYDADTECSGVT